MDKWYCSVCGYTYDPDKGDTDNNIPAGTKFEDVNEKWTCQICSINKYNFVKFENN